MGLDNFRGDVNRGRGSHNKKSEEELKEALKRFIVEEEEKLTYTNFQQTDGYPSSRTVEKRLGSWNEALKQVGADINKETSTIDVTDDMYRPSASKAYLVGALMGDGTINKVDSFMLPTVDKEFAVEVGKAFCEWSGLEWDGFNSDDTEVSTFIRELEEEEHNDQYVIKKGVSDIADHLRRYKYPDDPKEIINEFSGYKKELVRGLWDAEGSVKADGRILFTNLDESVVKIYTKTVSDVLRINSVERVGDGIKKFKSNEIYKVSRTDGAVNVVIPSEHKNKFISTVSPTIKRKFS